MRSEGGVAGEERLVGEREFYSFRGKCTMALTNMDTVWMMVTW